MMDILYIVRPSGWEYDEELRYSLRSLAMYGKNIGRVVVCGDIPDFLSDEVQVISCGNPFDRKAKNLTYRLDKAIESGLLGEHFLLSSDDIFHLREFDADAYPHYWKNGEQVVYFGTSKIARIINSAREFLQAHDLSVNDYGGGHCLHHVSRSIWKANASLIHEAQDTQYGVPVDLLCGALIDKHEHPQHIIRHDIKIEVPEDLLYCKGAECFSTNDNPHLWGGDTLLKQLYPHKCKWEK